MHHGTFHRRPSRKFKTISFAVAVIATGTFLQPVQAESSSNTTAVQDLLNKNDRTAFDSNTTQELFLGLFVYKLCNLPWLVDLAPHAIQLAEKMHLEGLVYGLIKHTFFRQFCGGETAEECQARMDQLGQSGIRCILDLSIEAHLEEDMDELAQPLGKWWRQEQSADVVLAMTEQCVHTAAQCPHSLAAIKITAFAPPELLFRMNQVITQLEQIFQANQVDGYVGSAALKQVVTDVLPPAISPQQEQERWEWIEYMHQHHPQIDSISFARLFDLQGPSRGVWWASRTNDGLVTQDDLEAYDRMVNRLDQVCSLAHRYHVGIMIDAEQSYFQEVIDHVAINLQAKYNRRDHLDHAPTVYNTYQMYKKTTQAKLERDVELSRRENFTFAAKLVRGAYMNLERKRAMQLGYPSPIHDTLEDTHDSYNHGVRFLLAQLHDYQQTNQLTASTSPIVVMVASHNRDSIIQTVEEMERQGIRPDSCVVQFGQLFGMQDQISYILGKHGYAIYKYLPYGMIDQVIPYLLRRAQENQAVMTLVNHDMVLMWTEIKNRIKASWAAPTMDEVDSQIQTTTV
ncbi:FAD-linked oxidoreductase-like protein [Chlamydoabsidia padenii]|nr:FAD-linked oxidoreductase-like protein [Chlamydoabsidia padenii]